MNHLKRLPNLRLKTLTNKALSFGSQVHHDERGSISVVSVFTFLFLTMVLGMVINLGRHTDRKVKLQNAADATAYSGGVVVARSMNTLAFTNHLLCDVFALTAYLREARDRNAESLTPEILAQWDHMAPLIKGAPDRKFALLGATIPEQTKREAKLIKIFGDQNAAVSERLLPVMEQILSRELIPQFQRDLVYATPELATEVANEIASRHGPKGRGLNPNEEMEGLMWCTDGSAFGERQSQSDLPQLPASDPVNDRTSFQPTYMRRGIAERKRMSFEYLHQLNNTMLVDFGRIGKMSNFKLLWEGFTRGYLTELLEEYPDRNIPYQIRIDPGQSSNPNNYIEREFMFVGAAYWKRMEERMPGLFKNPMDSDGIGFAQIQLFIPRNRLRRRLDVPPPWQISRQGFPIHRDLMNQNWTVQLVPGSSSSIPTILQKNPPGVSIQTPDLGGLSIDEFRQINTH